MKDIELTENYKNLIKKYINKNEKSLDHLSLKQLQCINEILLYGAKTNYRHCSPEFEGQEDHWLGYIGAGWFVEDRHNS